jgi:putative FmdB family regulatory protein
MPIYEYECTECGHHFERHQRISEDPVRICPVCSGELRRVFHPVGVIFKGSGFYVTDNRRTSTSTSRARSAEDRSSNGTGERIDSGGDSKETPKAKKSESETSPSKA